MSPMRRKAGLHSYRKCSERHNREMAMFCDKANLLIESPQNAIMENTSQAPGVVTFG